MPELISAKITEKVEFAFDINDHLQRLDRLERRMQTAFEDSKLPENPDRESINRLLIELRLANDSCGHHSW